MKVSQILIITTLTLFLFVGCKSKREKLGDENLAQKNYKVAVQMYLNAESKGEVSEEFPANISLALTGLMEEIALRDPLSSSISNYTEEIPKYLENVTNPDVIAQYGVTVAKITALRIKEGEFIPILQGFNAVEVAANLLKKINASNSEFESFVENLTNTYAKEVISNADSESDYVKAEYYLLEAEKAIPGNEDILEALNKIRLKNRSNFLIFSEDVNGINPSPLVDQNSFIIAFPNLKVTPTKVEGELQMWNTSGNNAGFKAGDIKLISTTGEEVTGKKIKGGCEKVANEEMCAMWVSFKFTNAFIPSYVLVKNGNAEGRKYLGVK